MTSSASAPAVRAKLVDKPADLDELRSTLGTARGRVSSARRGFGDEVLLRIEPPGAGARGDWRVGTQASDWVLASPSSVLPGAHASPVAIDKALAELGEAKVQSVEVTDSLALVIVFADGRWLEVHGFIDDPEEREDDPPYWEVFTPEDELLRAGPGPIWVRSAATVAPTPRSSGSSLTGLGVDDLLTLWSQVTIELRRRGVAMTSRSAMADTAEVLVQRYFGGFRGSYDRAGWDVLTDAGERIEVKALELASGQRLPPLAVGHREFDALVVVLFGDDLVVREAWHVPRDVVVQHLGRSPEARAQVQVELGQVLRHPSVTRLEL